MKVNPSFGRRRRSQQGYVLMVILLLMFFLMISLVAVVPRIKQDIQRQREEETIHRGQQYVRAIKRFYKKFGRYPNRLEDLENANNLRFLRKRYADPLAPDGSWRIIHFGEAKVLPKQLQALPGAAAAAGTPGLGPGGMMSSSFGATSSGIASPNASASAAPADSTLSADSGISAIGAPSSGGPGSPSAPGSSAPPGSPGTPASTMGTLAGRTFGGGAIIGLAPNSKEQSIKVLNEKDHYNDWEFVYDPRLDIAVPFAGAPGQQPGQPAGGVGSGPGFGNMGGFGSMQPSPQQPQQPPPQQIPPGVNPR